MEIPFNYIVINLMMILKDRKLNPTINKKALREIINIIINNLSIIEEEKINLIKEFDLDYELDKFYDEYMDYFYQDDNIITLDENVTMDELEEIIPEDDIDEYLMFEINNIIETNINIIELLGIKIKKGIYTWLSQTLKQDEELYKELQKTKTEETIKKIKLHTLKRRTLLLNLENLENEEISDLLLYCDDVEEKIPPQIIPFIIDNNQFDEKNINSSPFQKALFNVSMPNELITSYKLIYALETIFGIETSKYQDDYNFYLTYYYLLCEEIDKLPISKLKEELDRTKYKLMMILDSIFDSYLFMNIDSGINNHPDNYKCNELEAYFFIEEILSYKDEIYNINNSYIIEYFNIIKKLFIKTYYILTKDKNIITRIKENKLYNINKISSNLLKDIGETPKTKRIKLN